MLDITEISAVVAVAGVLVGVVYYILDIRNQSRVRLMDTTFRLYSALVTKEGTENFHRLVNLKYTDYDEFVKKYGLPFSENPTQILIAYMGSSLEGLGLEVKKKLVDIELIAELIPVPLMWDRIRPIAEGMRKQFNNPHFYEWAEYLYNEYMKHWKKREQQQSSRTA